MVVVGSRLREVLQIGVEQHWREEASFTAFFFNYSQSGLIITVRLIDQVHKKLCGSYFTLILLHSMTDKYVILKTVLSSDVAYLGFRNVGQTKK